MHAMMGCLGPWPLGCGTFVVREPRRQICKDRRRLDKSHSAAAASRKRHHAGPRDTQDSAKKSLQALSLESD